MLIQSEDKTRTLALHIDRSDDDYLASVEIRLPELTFAVGGIWVHASEFIAFCSALEQLETSRRGSAALASMSPKELRIELAVIDAAGHMEVRVEGECRRVGPECATPTRVSTGFTMDPSTLPGIVSAIASSSAGARPGCLER